MFRCSACAGLDFHDTGQLRFPLVTVLNKLLLVVEQLLVEECGVLEVGALDDGVNGAGLLAETTEDALGHVDIVLSGAARAIWPRLRLNSDSEGGASSLAQFASNAALLASWVTTESVLSTEHW